jgi:hypothetical protein
MGSFLRFLGLLNAGVWLGSSIFMVIVALTIFTTKDFEVILPTPPATTDDEKPANPRKGLAGQALFKRHFTMAYACAGLALAVLLLHWRVAEPHFPKARFGLLTVIIALTLGGGLWLTPRLGELLEKKYPEVFNATQMRDPALAGRLKKEAAQAAADHQRLHRISEIASLATMAALVLYFAMLCRRENKRRIT